MESIPESSLVNQAKAGDVTAFETLYRLYNNRIYNFAKQITCSAEDAGDIVQDTFVRAWSSLPNLHSTETFGIWLHRIALNLCRDLLKKRGRQYAISIDDQPDGEGNIPPQIEIGLPGPEHALISAEVQNAVRNAIDSLSDDHRLVVSMHHIEGMDIDSIVRVLGIPKGTAMSRLSRARDILKRKLAPFVEGD